MEAEICQETCVEDSFDILYERWKPCVCRWASRWVPRSEVEDVVSEVFIVLWERMKVKEEGFSPRLSWAYVVLRNKVGDRIRRSCSSVAFDESVHGVSCADFQKLVVRRRVVAEALRKLSSADREILQITYWKNLDSATAAKLIGLSSAAFRKRLSRARSRAAMLILGEE